MLCSKPEALEPPALAEVADQAVNAARNISGPSWRMGRKLASSEWWEADRIEGAREVGTSLDGALARQPPPGRFNHSDLPFVSKLTSE